MGHVSDRDPVVLNIAPESLSHSQQYVPIHMQPPQASGQNGVSEPLSTRAVSYGSPTLPPGPPPAAYNYARSTAPHSQLQPSAPKPVAAKPQSTGVRSKCCCFVIIGLIFAAALITTLVVMVTRRRGGQAGSDFVTLTFQSNAAKQTAMQAAVAEFNTQSNISTLPSGKRIQVKLYTPKTTPLDRDTQPDIYSPVSIYWVEKEMAVSNVTAQCRELTSVPVGIAMWRVMAEALGWPSKPISFRQIMELAAEPDGWGSLGQEYAVWGPLKYGHGHLNTSNSGRYGIIASIYGNKSNMTGAPTLLTTNMILDNGTREAVNALEQRTFHLGRSDNDLFDRMRARGKGYLHAIFTYESSVIAYNIQTQTSGVPIVDDLVFIYPSDGTFWAENPVCVLDNTDWARRNSYDLEWKNATKAFVDFLTSPAQQAKLPQYGVRPRDPKVDISAMGSIITQENGALPNMTIETVHRLPRPSQDIMDVVVNMWNQEKKPASIVVVLDTSGSMEQGGAMGVARENLKEFVRSLGDNDILLPMAFSGRTWALHSAGRVGDIRDDTLKAIQRLYADGSTALYKAMFEGLDYLNNQRANSTFDGVTAYNYALVVMTDGEDTEGGKDKLDSILPSGEDPSEVHIWGIAYGHSGDVGRSSDFFQSVARQTNGKSYLANTKSMADVWLDISSQF